MSTIVQIPASSVQNQVHYTQHQLNINSSSPLSNSSSNSSSSCLTTASYSPLQHQPILYTSSTNGSTQSLPTLNHTSSPIILSLPMVSTTTTSTGNSNVNANVTQQMSQGTISTGVVNSATSGGTNSTASLESTSPNAQSIYSYSSSTTTKPEAKKVKTQKTQPSKVVHIRNIPQQITEIEIIQFGLIFGNIANVLNLRSKCQVKFFSIF